MSFPNERSVGAVPDWPAFSSLPEFTPNPDALEEAAVVGLAAHDLRARPFALLRSQIQRRLRTGTRLVGVTSAAPNAGKSFLSLNLAASLARVSEVPVHLIDLDLKRASLAQALGMTLDGGISDWLKGNAQEIEAIGRRISGLNLAVYPTRRVEEGTAELLSGEAFARLIARLRTLPEEAIVLFDLPPVFVGDDTMIALEQLDGYVMVVDSGQTTAKQVSQALDLLEPSRCLGTILNRYQGGVMGSYGYGYGYGYGGAYR